MSSPEHRNTVQRTQCIKDLRSIIPKAKIPDSWPKIVFVCLKHYSVEEKTHVFSFSKESRKIRNGYSSNGYIRFKTMFPDSFSNDKSRYLVDSPFLDIFKKNTDSGSLFI